MIMNGHYQVKIYPYDNEYMQLEVGHLGNNCFKCLN